MTLSFTKEEVKRQLVQLGYKNITEDQLKEFVHDLRRLIKYDEKQKKLQELLLFDHDNNKAKKRPKSADSTYSSGSSSIDVTPRRSREREEQKVFKQERRTVHYNGNTGDVSVTSESVTASSYSYEEEDESVHIRINVPAAAAQKQQKKKKKSIEFDGACMDLLSADKVQILPPRPEIPTKPTSSFIRPVFKDPPAKNIRQDPVRLHKYYQQLWEKTKFPGDDSNKQLRWAVREWMMGPKDK